MKWLRDAGWVVAIVFVIVYMFWLRPAKQPNPDDVKAQIEKYRKEREERQAQSDKDLARINLESTERFLRLVGRQYRRYLESEKKPPEVADFREFVDDWKSRRDGEAFVIQWGVDLTKLPGGGAGILLAWEAKGDADSSRCVLMADAETTKVVTAAEFETLPKAK